MNIAILGHSIGLDDGKQKSHWIRYIQKHFNAHIVNKCVAQCSEERILFDLKKTKNIDLAIIIHAPPYAIFVPSWERDIQNVDKDSFNSKVDILKFLHSLNITDEEVISESVEWFSKVPNGMIPELFKEYGVEFEEMTPGIEDFIENNETDKIKKEFIELVDKMKGDVKYYNKLFEALVLQRKYLYHPDLAMNRYYGALIQVDQYITAMDIPCIHVLDNSAWYPKWFKFTSGVVEKTIHKIKQETSNYYVGYGNSCNAINEEGNKLIYEKLVDMAAGAGFEPAFTG